MPHVLNPDIKFTGTSNNCSHACENKELKLKFIITFSGFLERIYDHFVFKGEEFPQSSGCVVCVMCDGKHRVITWFMPAKFMISGW